MADGHSTEDLISGRVEVDAPDATVDQRKRRLLAQLRDSAYLAPMALAVMTMKANACSVTC